jgi:hypothetical protein
VIFTQIRPVWVDELGTMPNNSKSLWLGALYFPFYRRNFFSAVGNSAKMYKKAIFNPRPSKFTIFGLGTKSPTHTGLIGVQDI